MRYVAVFSHFREEGCAAAGHYSSAVFGTTRRYRSGHRGADRLLFLQSRPSFVFHEDLEDFGKKHGGGVSPPILILVHFLEAGLDKDTEALGHVTNYTSKKVKRWTTFATRTSRETPSEGGGGERKGKQVVADQPPY